MSFGENINEKASLECPNPECFLDSASGRLPSSECTMPQKYTKQSSLSWSLLGPGQGCAAWMGLPLQCIEKATGVTVRGGLGAVPQALGG